MTCCARCRPDRCSGRATGGPCRSGRGAASGPRREASGDVCPAGDAEGLSLIPGCRLQLPGVLWRRVRRSVSFARVVTLFVKFLEPPVTLQDGPVHRAFPHPPAELNQRYLDKVISLYSSIENLEPLGGALRVQQAARR